MIQAYRDYKDWWMDTAYLRYSEYKSHVEFEEHINGMTLFELMEKLDLWSEEE